MAKTKEKNLDTSLPWLLVTGGFIGLIASLILTLEKIALLKDPAHQLSCSLNPILSCGPIIASGQASAFGFPNPFIGLAGFSVVITIGMGIFAGANYKKWFWKGLNIGSLLAVIFLHWLMFQSFFSLEALCLYCMVVWFVTIPIFYYTTLYNLRHGNIVTPPWLKSTVNFINRHHGDLLLTWFALIVITIVIKFWYYWSTLF